ncbi:uncharacterized protein [Coffea arabica]|uniref:RNase H type-1 domain-containing protein n=1 Tax=Coffea arabica TaxID=13443 RepID=A0ABM4VQE5_COFAR
MEAQDSGREYIDQMDSSRLATWKPPGKGVIRINTDAAFSAGMDQYGLGGVARDWKEGIIKAWANAARKTNEPLVEEAVAIRMGMIKAKEAQWKVVEFQSDCKVVVEMIMKESIRDSRVAVILEDIQNMKSLFDKCTFSFVNRLGNGCAHNLAKFAVKLVRQVDWEGNFPMWLKESAQKDLLVSYPVVT